MESSEVTLTEYMAGCLSRILGAMNESTMSARHTEGMVGAMDQFAESLAERAAIPYASSAKVREALDANRRLAMNGK